MLKSELEEQGYTNIKVFENNRRAGIARQAAIAPFLFTHAIVCDFDYFGYGDRWCYHSMSAAVKALDAWNGEGEPEGWHRHPDSGRRRDEDGNETK